MLIIAVSEAGDGAIWHGMLRAGLRRGVRGDGWPASCTADRRCGVWSEGCRRGTGGIVLYVNIVRWEILYVIVNAIEDGIQR